MSEKLKALKAELSMKVAGFIFQKHTNPVLKFAASAAGWGNRKRYGKNALDFLEHEESIDIMLRKRTVRPWRGAWRSH